MEATAAVNKPQSERAQNTSAALAGFVKLADERELEPHAQLTRWLDGHDILVYRLEGKLKAISNICPHFGGPVGYHKMKDGMFTCLWHNYQFDAKTGQCLNNRHLCLREYTLKVENGEIWVRLVEKAD